MSVGSKSLPARRGGNEAGHENGDGAVVTKEEEGGGGAGGSRSRSRRQKPARYDRWFSGQFSIGPGPLKDVDAGKLKDQIRRWAKAVVAFARQISFGSPRSASARTPGAGGDDTPRSAPLRGSRSTSRLAARGAQEGASPPRSAPLRSRFSLRASRSSSLLSAHGAKEGASSDVRASY